MTDFFKELEEFNKKEFPTGIFPLSQGSVGNDSESDRLNEVETKVNEIIGYLNERLKKQLESSKVKS